MASPMRCTRMALVLPGVPGGLPATITTRSPRAHRPMSPAARAMAPPVATTPSEPGFVVKTSGGNLVAGLRGGLYERNEADATWHERWRGGWDTSIVRINDGKTDRSGRLWFVGAQGLPEVPARSGMWSALWPPQPGPEVLCYIGPAHPSVR
jgi:hypothetical protein